MKYILAMIAVAGMMIFAANTVEAARPHHRGHISFGNPHDIHIDLYRGRLHVNPGNYYYQPRHHYYRPHYYRHNGFRRSVLPRGYRHRSSGFHRSIRLGGPRR